MTDLLTRPAAPSRPDTIDPGAGHAPGLQPGRRTSGGSRHRGERQRSVRLGSPRRRAGMLILVTILVFGVFAARLVQIQVVERGRYTGLGDEQGIATREIPAVRGAILDRDLGVLTMSDDRPSVWADPRLVTDPRGTAEALSLVLDIDVDQIAERLGSDRHFVYVARQVSPGERRAVQELGLAGVGFADESARLATNGDDLARGLLGLVDIDENPLSGLEKQFTEVLSGTEGQVVTQVGAGGIALPVGTRLDAAEQGHDIVLTLDTETQWLAEQVLLDAVAEAQARGGIAVVMEVATGEVLAAAAVVRDPETDVTSVARYNAAYIDTFEPGSVAKPFTVAAALEENLTTRNETFTVPVHYEFADKLFEELHATETKILSVEEIISTSSNIGTIQIAERLGQRELYRYLRRFGFGEATGTAGAPSVPGESAGILHPIEEWHGTTQATISFGQGFAVTAIQLAAAYNTIANDGLYLPPRLVRGTVGPDGAFHPAPVVGQRQVIGADTAADVRAMLERVVTEGTGTRAAVPGYRSAGKTGTAQKHLENGRGYSITDYTSTFAGMVPADQPELTIVVSLDEAEQYGAGLVAAPVFAEVAEYALRVLRVAPSE